MSRKGQRTKGLEEAHPFAGMSRVNPNAAGVDIGAAEIVVCVAGDESTQIVKGFGNYTVDLQAIGKWLKEYHVESVAMESTGVYWILLFEELERQGFECLLVSSRSLRRVSGKKSDIQDAQWIQTLHSYGLLEGSFPTAGRFGDLADVAAASRPIGGSPLAARPAHAEGAAANERAALAGGDGCDGTDRAGDSARHRGGGARPAEIGGIAGSELQEG